jgi:hypothetical protein
MGGGEDSHKKRATPEGVGRRRQLILGADRAGSPLAVGSDLEGLHRSEAGPKTVGINPETK